MKIITRIWNYLFPIMSITERSEKWCKSIGKSKHYGEDMKHDKLDNIGFPKRRIIKLK